MLGLHLLLWFTSLFFPLPQGPIFGGTSGGGTPTFTVVGTPLATYCTATFPCSGSYSPTSGNAVRVDIYIEDAGNGYTAAVTDNASGGSSTYTQIFQHTDSIAGFNGSAIQYAALNVKSGVTSITVTLTGSGGAPVGGFNIIEYHRTSGSWTTDQSSAVANFSSVTSQSCTAITTTGTPSVAMYWILNQDDSTHGFTGASSYTNEVNNPITVAGQLLGSGDLIQTSAGATTPATTTGAAVSGSCYSSSLK